MHNIYVETRRTNNECIRIPVILIDFFTFSGEEKIVYGLCILNDGTTELFTHGQLIFNDLSGEEKSHLSKPIFLEGVLK